MQANNGEEDPLREAHLRELKMMTEHAELNASMLQVWAAKDSVCVNACTVFICSHSILFSLN